MSKQFQYIIIFVFLSGMLFTILNYLPILEEETPGHRVELNKKADSGTDSDSDGQNDTDSDNSNEADIHPYLVYAPINDMNASANFYIKNKLYPFPPLNTLTPPPKELS